MSEINPNVNMTETQSTTQGKIELNSGSGPVSFDELEQVEKESKKIKAQEKKEKNEKSIDLTSDTDKGKPDKKDTPKEPKEPAKKEATKEEQTTENEKQIEKARKLIKAKYQDKEIDLDEESVVPVKINGKEELVQVKDLMGNYSGKVAWDKQFTELSKMKKTQAANELKLRQAADHVKNLFQIEDPTSRMFEMAKLAGVDPIQFRQKFYDENISLLEKYYSMSDDERKADQLAYEAQLHKHRADTLENQYKQEQTQRELKAKIDNLRASHQVDDDMFESYQEQVSELVRNGAIDKSQATPEFIIETIQKDRLWSAANEELSKLDLPWDTQARNQKLLALVENAHHLGFKPEEMAEIVSETWGDKKALKRVQQIKDEKQEFLTGKKDVKQHHASSRSEQVFFDDL